MVEYQIAKSCQSSWIAKSCQTFAPKHNVVVAAISSQIYVSIIALRAPNTRQLVPLTSSHEGPNTSLGFKGAPVCLVFSARDAMIDT